MSKVKTIKLKGNEYAEVPERLKEFRSRNPRAKVETIPTFNPDGSLIFQAKILSDKSKPSSAESNGTSFTTAKQLNEPKAFEKAETIAVGRALSLLGYLNDGQIASTEEIEEFESFKEEKSEVELEKLTKIIKKAKTINELKEIFLSLNAEQKIALNDLKDKRKVELENASSKNTAK